MLAVLSLGLAACADPPGHPAGLLAAPRDATAVYVLQKTVKGKPSFGATQRLVEGSTWLDFGRVAEGTVYKPRDSVLSVERINVSEAYVVVHDGNWVGFYLPVEKTFVPITRAVPFEIARKEGP
jgi:hypothetical protein